MRVALNALFLESPATGTGQYLIELTRALRARYPHDSFTYLARTPAAYPAPLEIHPTRLRGANLSKLEFEQRTFPAAAQRRRKFDLAHVPHFGPPLFPLLPTVVTIHDLIPVVLPAYRGSFGVRAYTSLAGRGARRAAAVLADSEASARDIQSRLGIPREKIHVVYLAADARFQPEAEPAVLGEVRRKYNLPGDFVLYLGGFDVRKNVRRVLESFAALQAERRAGLKLVLAGKLPETPSDFFPDPRALTEKLNLVPDVVFAGFIDDRDKPALYAAAKAFLFPSLYEGFGLPPLEAMASGTPVICANTASLPEVVGDAGILLAPDDAAGWINALRGLLENEARRRELVHLGIAQARKFSWDRAAHETMQVYQSVLATGTVEGR